MSIGRPSHERAPAPGRAAPPSPSRPSRSAAPCRFAGRLLAGDGAPRRSFAAPAELDQLDLVAVGILDEGDLGAAVLHRPGLAHDPGPLGAQLVAGAIDVLDAERDVPEAGAELVELRVPVVRELEDGVVALVAVADEGEREAAVRVVLAAQEPHAEHVAVEAERALEVPDPQHGVEHAHGGTVPLAASARKTQ